MNNFIDIYNKQVDFQQMLVDKNMYEGTFDKPLPADYPKIFGSQILHLMAEMGEALAADKRWKEYRKDKYDKDEKYEEIADCLVFLLNVAIYSGMQADELLEITSKKIDKNYERIKAES